MNSRYNYVIGCLLPNGMLSCYSVGAQVLYGDDTDSQDMLTHVRGEEPHMNWEVYKIDMNSPTDMNSDREFLRRAARKILT